MKDAVKQFLESYEDFHDKVSKMNPESTDTVVCAGGDWKLLLFSANVSGAAQFSLSRF